jgi:hypothetical protein
MKKKLFYSQTTSTSVLLVTEKKTVTPKQNYGENYSSENGDPFILREKRGI